MPKRVIDGEGLWRSVRLRELTNDVRAEYANLLPLAMANGVFEFDSERIWSIVYSFNRPNVSLDDVEYILNELVENGLLFVWRKDGKMWGYWVGCDKPGRLPGPSRRGTNEIVGPEPPRDQLAAYKEKASKMENGFVYFISSTAGFIKVGRSYDPKIRLKALQKECPGQTLEILGVVSGGPKKEREIHQIFAEFRCTGEWFLPVKELKEYILLNTVKSTDSVGIQKLLGLGSGLCLGFGLGEGVESPHSESEEIGEKQMATRKQFRNVILRAGLVPDPPMSPSWPVLDEMVDAFEDTDVLQIFETWVGNRVGETRFPISLFVRDLPALVQTPGLKIRDEGLDKLSDELYTIGEAHFTGAVRNALGELRTEFSDKEIILAWRQFIRDEATSFSTNWPKKFVEGGCGTIIRVMRKENTRRADNEKALEAQTRKDRAEYEAERARIEAEKAQEKESVDELMRELGGQIQ